MAPTKILFVGNFYSAKGTHNIGAKIIQQFKSSEYETSSVDMPKNPLLRIVVLLWKLSTTNFNVLHLEVYSGRYFLMILPIVTTLCKIRRKNIIMNIAGGATPEYHTKYPRFVMHQLSQAKVLASPSKRIIQHFAKTNPELNIKYLPNFIDLNLFPKATQRNFHYSLLWVRAFREIYNPLIAIQAVEQLIHEFPDIHLTMIGPDGGLQQQCQSYIEQHQLQKHITFKGSIPNNELFTYYQSHDVYLNTTSYESFGFALVEAASCGLPITSSNVGEIPLLWNDEQNILLFENKNATKLAHTIKRLFGDEDLRKRISDNGYSLAQQFGWNPFHTQFLSLLKQAHSLSEH